MTQTTRFLVISDTHDKWPYAEEAPPKVDVFLHCGDLTQVGGLPSFKRAMENIKSVDAELRLVIAGNHDLELDEEWVRRNTEDADLEEELEDSRRCVEYLKSLKDLGIHYLEEGVHKFMLKSGHSFSIYASPYTPEFMGYAFAYGSEDRFNDGPQPIPAGVDIVMTHGPPLVKDLNYSLDSAKDGKHVGCDRLNKAIERTKPRLHCFGHVHEGRGAAKISWNAHNGGIKIVESAVTKPVLLVENTKETVLLNAAINENGDTGFVVAMNLNC